MLKKEKRDIREISVMLPWPGGASTARVLLCRPSEFLLEQECEQGDQEDQTPGTQSPGQGTSQGPRDGGGSSWQCSLGTTSPATPGPVVITNPPQAELTTAKPTPRPYSPFSSRRLIYTSFLFTLETIWKVFFP